VTPEDAPPASARAAIRIAATAWLILFLELALIRFLSAYVRVFAFYTNFVIIAAFLGMGTGMLRWRAADRLRWAFPPVLALLLGCTAYLAMTPIDVRPNALEWLWGAESAAGERHVPLAVAVVGLFALVTATFVPLGAALGSAMRRLPPLPAYAADLVGSLAGVLSLALMSAGSSPPTVWFSVAGVVGVALALPRRAIASTVAAGWLVAIGVAAWLGSRQAEDWSPYYRITRTPSALPGGTVLSVNGALHQVMLDFSRDAESPALDAQHRAYLRPYAHVSRLDTALVVGAGTGNDVAILLALGAKYVDAVEIDPVIAGIGRAAHPARPYDDPRVHLTVTDARAFLRRPPRHYDVITFGTLDSQTLLGGMTSVRLDNYVYTTESFDAARAALAPGGTVVMYHLSGLWFIAARLYQNLTKAFGAPPRVFAGDDGLFTYTFVAGAGAEGAPPQPADSPLVMRSLRLSTDDWPYPYLRGRRIPAHYLVVLGAVLAIGVVFVAGGAGMAALRQPDWPLFLTGAGFLLLETHGIATMSLLFGSTWTVNAAVIASILAVAFAVTLAAHVGRGPGYVTCAVALVVLLGLAALMRPGAVTTVVPGLRWLIAGAYVGAPVLFASFIFARAYAGRPDPTAALAYNVLGAVAGGVLEYASMAFGLAALNWLAAAAYVAAVGLLLRGARVARVAVAPTPS
jgi:hypothetical protein